MIKKWIDDRHYHINVRKFQTCIEHYASEIGKLTEVKQINLERVLEFIPNVYENV